jgi:hypothetical protein
MTSSLERGGVELHRLVTYLREGRTLRLMVLCKGRWRDLLEALPRRLSVAKQTRVACGALANRCSAAGAVEPSLYRPQPTRSGGLWTYECHLARD